MKEIMKVSEFIAEINSIENPSNRSEYLSTLINNRMEVLESEYTKKSIEYVNSIKTDARDANIPTLVKKLKSMSITQNKLLMILDNLLDDDQI